MTAADEAGRPWWASDAERLGHEDPVESHRRARAGGTEGEPTDGRGDGHTSGADGDPAGGRPGDGHASGPGGGHPWWADAADLLVRFAREAGRAGAAANGRAGTEGAGTVGSDHVHTGTVDACQICPVCAGIRVLGEVRPEVVGHVSEALHHLTLALKAVVDAQAGSFGDGGLQRIDLDDE